MKSITSITPSVKYIGVDDADLDLFESQYAVPDGISYNSYLIMDKKITIMDTVDKRGEAEWWENITSVLEGRNPDYLIVEHMEPDHTACIAAVAERYPQLQIVASHRTAQMLPQFFPKTNFTNRITIVKEGNTLSLGRHSLRFYTAPMVHWPEVIVTYDQTDRLLFSADAFGSFGILRGDIAKPTDSASWSRESRRYYYNVCGKYGTFVQALLKKIKTLDIERICPLHGPTLSGGIRQYVDLYDTWSRYQAESQGVLIAYASIHGNTTAAAQCMAKILRSKGAVGVKFVDLSRDDMSMAVTEAFRMKQLILAASSYDSSVFPPMYDFLHHLQLKGYQCRRVGLIENGSWAPSAGRVMSAMQESMKGVERLEPIVTIRSTMQHADILAMESLAETMLAGKNSALITT